MPDIYIRKTPADIVGRFLSKFEIIPDACWEWKGPFNQHGYGRLNFFKIYHAHRFSYEYYKGKIPEGLFVLHKCDNRKCVNPDHLWIGTAGDNFRDCRDKGRHPITKFGVQPKGFGHCGENHPNAKLTESIVLKIKEKLNTGCSIANVVKEFNVKYQTAYRIKNNLQWRHILCR